MEANENKHYVFNKRDSAESERLNWQHNFFRILVGGIPHPSVSTENAKNIADVGTGTGIWLLDLSEKLASTQLRDGSKRHFHGFDITEELMPDVLPSDITFSIHDILKPFPLEHKGKYDFVHVRLLVFAIREIDIKIAVQNVTELLRPGGYIEWFDVSYNSYIEANPQLDFFHETYMPYLSNVGFSMNFPSFVEQACEELNMEVLVAEHHLTEGRPELITLFREWHRQTMRVIAPNALLRGGKANDDETAKQRVGVLLKRLEAMFEKGYVVEMMPCTIVARKVN